ncbi:MAG: threonine ammonia-lyase, biosynthetic [Immundisolibacter sp.]|uniref:threonine ammonia-lyase, biosynthetic n=1 Tax=Immundisolibacter sp. TaxID=1934948 RepID=UPI003D0F263A
MARDYLVLTLNARVYDVAIESPLDTAENLSLRLKNRVLLKREDLQPVFSFKLRGAFNKMSHLPRSALKAGVVTASAGNHAQGVALAAHHLGSHALIVMPVTTPQIKVDAVQRLGGETLLFGEDYAAASRHALALAEQRGLSFVHPYDDPLVIAGQGTIGAELLRQRQGALDAIFVPVGGGGLIGGIAAYVKRLRPQVRIVGVESDDADAMARSLQTGRRVSLRSVGLFADGTAVRQVGREPFRLAREYVDEMLLVDHDEICAAIKDTFEDTRAIVEPAGALALAGLKRYVARERCHGQTLVAVCSGANMNFDRLRYVAERAEIGERREAIFAATIPERPGSFVRFCEAIGAREISEFNYRYASAEAAQVYVGVRTAASQREALFADLRRRGYAVVDLTDSEAAKLHLRHMVGGHGKLPDEVVYRFTFDERPGALAHFLARLGAHWNISLFHYRNHGAADGRALVGLQVPPAERARFKAHLAETGLECVDETDSAGYRLFLA